MMNSDIVTISMIYWLYIGRGVAQREKEKSVRYR